MQILNVRTQHIHIYLANNAFAANNLNARTVKYLLQIIYKYLYALGHMYLKFPHTLIHAYTLLRFENL